MSLERLDSRALAAIRFLDGETGQPLTGPLHVSGNGIRVVRNPSGLYALTAAPGFEDYTARFEAPPEPAPAPATLPVTVVDPSGRHLPRGFTLELPRDASLEPEHPEQSVFAPVDVRMYLAPTARRAPGSAVVRLSLRDGQDNPLARVVIRLRVAIPDKPAVEGLGLSDERGEVLLLVPRIPIIRWGQEEGDALIHTTFPATLESAIAPSVAGLPDPDMPAPSFTPLPQTLQVASGLEIHRRIQIPTS
ncbi:hypothetical protein [Vitiosangium sp. GDMCC 1.1324]|uniref:hypothetical protein n=1 Tax=Vitiosangium sp. (strain GDMCC 1.1324) TaxID=2138576 RepID=UPI000D396B0E|nr:hypothetical protein [Vitiosangium sp. GDMCC 1.1324]PTL85218.1 hypothetical protein DAT35_00365 [Vitiosangium sp. GDMCC 1.1324]